MLGSRRDILLGEGVSISSATFGDLGRSQIKKKRRWGSKPTGQVGLFKKSERLPASPAATSCR